MKKELIEYCNSIGIECVGIAPTGPYTELEQRLKEREQTGAYTGLEERDLQRRVNPSLTMEGVQSIIVCLFPYYVGKVKEANISKYTFSIDYHLIAKEALERIGTHLQSKVTGFQYQTFIDNGPLVDRYLAYLAGLGFWGINSHLITDKFGSYVFIGYMMTNYPFEPDRPQVKTCMQCFNCVKACPGQIILGNFDIDPRGCKSFLTQKKEELTEKEIEIVRKTELIYGCDVCQDVCPHNGNAAFTNMEAFKRDLMFTIDPEELEIISNKEFKRRYGDRAFSWRGKKVILKNARYLQRKDKKE